MRSPLVTAAIAAGITPAKLEQMTYLDALAAGKSAGLSAADIRALASKWGVQLKDSKPRPSGKGTEVKAPSSTKELRAFLLEQMVSVADGSQEPAQSKAICNYAQQVYNTVSLEIKHSQAKAKIGEAGIADVSFTD